MESELGNHIFSFLIFVSGLKYSAKYLLHLHLMQLGESLSYEKDSYIIDCKEIINTGDLQCMNQIKSNQIIKFGKDL